MQASIFERARASKRLPGGSVASGFTDNGDRLDFDLGASRQRRHLDGRPGWRILREELSVDRVHLAEFAQIAHVNRGLDRQPEGRAARLEDVPEVEQGLAR